MVRVRGGPEGRSPPGRDSRPLRRPFHARERRVRPRSLRRRGRRGGIRAIVRAARFSGFRRDPLRVQGFERSGASLRDPCHGEDGLGRGDSLSAKRRRASERAGPKEAGFPGKRPLGGAEGEKRISGEDSPRHPRDGRKPRLRRLSGDDGGGQALRAGAGAGGDAPVSRPHGDPLRGGDGRGVAGGGRSPRSRASPRRPSSFSGRGVRRTFPAGENGIIGEEGLRRDGSRSAGGGPGAPRRRGSPSQESPRVLRLRARPQ